ncbi:MAG: hypothetical protein FWG73_07715, partial [Planctomycetaceae bacterium]|nr:hypothetical protein [Planctomycetaceae bacterium]
VAEVTHYEIGLRNGSSIMSFTIDQLNVLEALVADIDGAEIINGIIRFDKSITSTGALALGIGFKENLAIRAIVVDATGMIERESANANRSVRVPG